LEHIKVENLFDLLGPLRFLRKSGLVVEADHKLSAAGIMKREERPSDLGFSMVGPRVQPALHFDVKPFGGMLNQRFCMSPLAFGARLKVGIAHT
jgi:hypothetical protein